MLNATFVSEWVCLLAHKDACAVYKRIVQRIISWSFQRRRMCLPPLDRFASEAYIMVRMWTGKANGSCSVCWASRRLLDIGAHIGYYALYMKRPPSCHTCGVGRRQGGGMIEVDVTPSTLVLTEARSDRALFDLAIQASYAVFAFVRISDPGSATLPV